MSVKTKFGAGTAALLLSAASAQAFEFNVSGDVTLQYKIDEATPGLDGATGVVSNFDDSFSELRFDVTVEGGQDLGNGYALIGYFDAIDFTFEDIDDGEVAYGIGIVTPVGLFQVRTGVRNGDEAPLGFDIEEAEFLYGIEYEGFTGGIAYAPEYGQTRVVVGYEGRTSFAGANGYSVDAEYFRSDLDGFETLASSLKGAQVIAELEFDDFIIGATANYLKANDYLAPTNTTDQRSFGLTAEYEVTSKFRVNAGYTVGNTKSSSLAFAELPTAGNITASGSGYLAPVGPGSLNEDYSTLRVGFEYDVAANTLFRFTYTRFDDVLSVANDDEDGPARGLLRRTNGDVFDLRLTYRF